MKLFLAACAAIVITAGTAGASAAQNQPQRHPVASGPSSACKADVEKLCAGVQPGGGRIRECMKAHRDQISDACKTAIASRMGHEAPGH
jgi:hypothetical protein